MNGARLYLVHTNQSSTDQPRSQPQGRVIRDGVRHVAFIAAVALFFGAFTLLRIMLSIRGLR